MIRLQSIVKSYEMGNHTVRALRGVDLHVGAGEMVAIMGPSGSGKSTLMNVLGCLDRPCSGTYLLDGEDVSRLGSDELSEVRNKKIGFVFQSFNLLALDSAAENVALPLIYGGARDAKERALAAIEKVGLASRAHHKPSELSGGQRQRVAIARAIVGNPPLILADEPTGNLDTKTGEEILAIFSELNSAGATVVLVTHERDIAVHCERIITLRDGLIDTDERLGSSSVEDGSMCPVEEEEDETLHAAV
jgi:putative ABC transport system ATP-binding protein